MHCAVGEERCLLPSPSAVNVTSASFKSAAKENIGRARAYMRNNGMAMSIIAKVLASVVSWTPTAVRPECFVESLSVMGEEELEFVFSRGSSLVCDPARSSR